ncbi:acetate/propionate family kinase [Haloglycomyces albus]|uniref:acetate/propionate family kinase n=1 Tax=Haloglycomyces albus TaxID=526067 RepID=UPI00046CFB6A|nr:acetate kinase [Haloglycomyces albus]
MSTPVLVINSGSSSLKYQLIDADDLHVIASGLVERIGEEDGCVTHKSQSGKQVEERPVVDHGEAITAMVEAFRSEGSDLNRVGLKAVAHRVVHGGERFIEPTVITDEVERAIADLAQLAPLHNPANLEGIRVSRRMFRDLPQVAVFDTAFHSTMPPHAYNYAVPSEWREDYGVRRYGFHGTSHSYVSRQAAGEMGKDPRDVNVIVAHLGNGASVTAVSGGRSIDTSMGLTPLEGLVMGTRSGDIDPAIVFHMHRQGGLDVNELDQALNKRSGMLAMTGMVDMRGIEAAAHDGDSAADAALDLYAYRIRKYLGAYMASLGRTDAIAFTAGVGENSPSVRQRALAGLEPLGVVLDEKANEIRGTVDVTGTGSKVRILVIPTNEEGEIATQSAMLLRGEGKIS